MMRRRRATDGAWNAGSLFPRCGPRSHGWRVERERKGVPMEIKNNLNPLDPYTRTKLAGTHSQENTRGARGVAAPASESGDRVSLSPEAKLHTEAHSAAMNAPDVRQAKIDELKARIESGTYQPDSRAIAARLLAEEPGLFQP